MNENRPTFRVGVWHVQNDSEWCRLEWGRKRNEEVYAVPQTLGAPLTEQLALRP
jgi:hypothetical protein